MITPRQCKAARALLGWTQADLAEAAKIPMDTISRFENGKSDTRGNALIDIQKALQRGGVKLLNAEGHEGEGVRVASAKA
ncbi:MAG TPA: helix-turn-helix transcriptional regulator [Rhizomicrobium sp.]|nr:helix-turn-helix transcriptional regulator [Rhizomicrobium sp.]